MKQIFLLLQNPFIRFIGICIILYFALFQDKSSPENLANRLSGRNLKEKFSQIQDQGKYIVSNLSNAKSISPEQIRYIESDLSKITFEDQIIGEGENFLKCGDLAKVSVGIYISSTGNQIEFQNNKNILVGENKDNLLEKNIIGMKIGGVRNIKIPKDFKSINVKISSLLRFNNSDLFYKVTLLDLKKFQDIKC